MPLVSFFTPRELQRTRGFLKFSGGIEREWLGKIPIVVSFSFFYCRLLKNGQTIVCA